MERAATPPSAIYTGAETLERERRAIFNRTWQLVGRLDQVAEPGSYFTAEVAGEPVIIARDRDAELRAFFNVCRHRAGPVACGAGARTSFQCRYHGWTYSLDGRLLGTPEFDGVECFDKADNGLVQIKLATWEQFIFVNLDPTGAPALEELLEDIPSLTEHIGMSSMKLVERRDYLINCNWKVYVENYLEGYHLPMVHPGLMRELDYANYRTITRRYYSMQDAPIKRAGENAENRRYRSSDELPEALYFWVFPNLMININPETTSTNLIVPLSEDRTLTVFEWLAHDPADDEARKRMLATIEFSEEIQQEDIWICEAVQRGLKSVSYDRGRYSVKRENGVHHFHSLWREFFEVNSDKRPGRGKQ